MNERTIQIFRREDETDIRTRGRNRCANERTKQIYEREDETDVGPAVAELFVECVCDCVYE